MIDLFLKFQINIFINEVNILPDNSTISKLLELFKDDDFIPSIIHEIGPKGPQPQLRMSSPNGMFEIIFLSNKINITQHGGPNKTGNEADEFLAKTKEISRKIFDYLGRKSWRLAFIANLMLVEMSDEKLEECYKSLFIPLPMYKENPPFEWNNRSISRGEIPLADTTEIFNIITEIHRLKGRMIEDAKSTNIERIHLAYEINTQAENKDTRFEASQLGAFLDIAKDNLSSVVKELEGVINV